MEVKVYINTWRRYHEGYTGKWFTLGEMDSEDLLKELEKEVVDFDPEYFIQDTNTTLEGIEEATDFLELNEVLLSLGSYEEEFEAVAEWEGIDYAMDASANRFEAYILYHGAEDEEDLGRCLVDDGLLDVPEEIEMYFDFEAYGRDYSINTGGCFVENGYIMKF